jgi:hypothetical protein
MNKSYSIKIGLSIFKNKHQNQMFKHQMKEI